MNQAEEKPATKKVCINCGRECVYDIQCPDCKAALCCHSCKSAHYRSTHLLNDILMPAFLAIVVLLPLVMIIYAVLSK